MAPVSVLPGRVRIDVPALVGQRDRARAMERWIRDGRGIFEVSANHRTGRILVRFDELTTSRMLVSRRIEEGLAGQGIEKQGAGSGPRRGRKKLSSRFARHALFDVVAHAVLPAPLNLLLPAALAAFGR